MKRLKIHGNGDSGYTREAAVKETPATVIRTAPEGLSDNPRAASIMLWAAITGLIIGAVALVMRPKKAY